MVDPNVVVMLLYPADGPVHSLVCTQYNSCGPNSILTNWNAVEGVKELMRMFVKWRR